MFRAGGGTRSPTLLPMARSSSEREELTAASPPLYTVRFTTPVALGAGSPNACTSRFARHRGITPARFDTIQRPSRPAKGDRHAVTFDRAAHSGWPRLRLARRASSGGDAGRVDHVPGPVPRRGERGARRRSAGCGRSVDVSVRTSALPPARRGNRVAQLRATRPRRAARARRRRELLDVDVHQLAAHGALRPCVVAGLSRRRTRRDRSAHSGVLVRAGDRPRAARRRRSEGSTTRSRSTTATRSGTRSTTTTGPRCTSSTRTASSATTTSERAATSNRNASSRSCSASSATSLPS